MNENTKSINAINDFRPANLNTFICNLAKSQELYNILGNVSKQLRSFLISGSPGMGKTTFAYIFANNLGGINWDIPVETLEFNCADKRGVDFARELAPILASRPLGNGYRVVILDEAHMMTPEAQTALLKPIETIPEGIYLFACSSDPSKLSPAFKSRLKHISIMNPSQDQIDQYFKDRVREYYSYCAIKLLIPDYIMDLNDYLSFYDCASSIITSVNKKAIYENIKKLGDAFIANPYSLRDFTLDIVKIANGEEVDYFSPDGAVIGKKTPFDLANFLVSNRSYKESYISYIYDVLESFDCSILFVRNTIAETAYRRLRDDVKNAKYLCYIISLMNFDCFDVLAKQILFTRIVSILSFYHEKDNAVSE